MADLLRAHLARVLDWEEAHVGFDKTVEGIPAEFRGQHASGFEHSPWQLLEHLRIAQRDILDFCMNEDYVHALIWPDGYWPATPGPADDAEWDTSVAAFKRDREVLKALASNSAVDLLAPVPTGTAAQTYLRAILLVADHASYHLGQLVAVRRALGIWY